MDRPKREDEAYVLNSNGCIFLFTEALAGWHIGEPKEHRANVDWTHHIQRKSNY